MDDADDQTEDFTQREPEQAACALRPRVCPDLIEHRCHLITKAVVEIAGIEPQQKPVETLDHVHVALPSRPRANVASAVIRSVSACRMVRPTPVRRYAFRP